LIKANRRNLLQTKIAPSQGSSSVNHPGYKSGSLFIYWLAGERRARYFSDSL